MVTVSDGLKRVDQVKSISGPACYAVFALQPSRAEVH